MLIISIKENESIDKALKRFKKKFEKTGVVKELRRRSALKNHQSLAVLNLFVRLTSRLHTGI